MPKYPDDYYLSRQEIDVLRSEAKHAAKYMKALFNFKIEARYSFSVNWSVEDKEFVGLCAEFPSLSWLDPDPDKARSGIERLVFETLQEMNSTG
ncbi:antitoxin HicB [Acinetobacter pseudolwoffii]|uniref:antitoxin HicB n=1 Tax=Acinetobacter pseudolwoffii TaxID=2053287 RepID=UPI003FD6DD34